MRFNLMTTLTASCLLAGSALAQEPTTGRGGGPARGMAVFERHDADGNGVVTRDEVPERGQRLFDRLGKDALTRSDVEQLRGRLRSQGGQAGLQRGQARSQRGQARSQREQARGRGPGLGRGSGLGQGAGPRAAGPTGRRGRTWQRDPLAGPRQGAGQAGQRQAGPRKGAGQADRGQGMRRRALRRNRPLVWRELGRMRREEPQRFEQLRERLQNRRAGVDPRTAGPGAGRGWDGSRARPEPPPSGSRPF